MARSGIDDTFVRLGSLIAQLRSPTPAQPQGHKTMPLEDRSDGSLQRLKELEQRLRLRRPLFSEEDPTGSDATTSLSGNSSPAAHNTSASSRKSPPPGSDAWSSGSNSTEQATLQDDAAMPSTSPAVLSPPSVVVTEAAVPGLCWSIVNSRLVQHGLPAINEHSGAGDGTTGSQAQPSLATLHAVLSAAVSELDRRLSQVDILRESAKEAGRREAAAVRAGDTAAKQHAGEVRDLRRAAREAQRALEEARALGSASRNAAQSAAADAQRSQKNCHGLQRQLQAKEDEIAGLRRQLQAQDDKERRRKAAAEDAYQSLRRAYAAADKHGSPSRGLLHGPAGKLTPLQVVRIYESQVARAEEELHAARVETRVLADQLRAGRHAAADGSPAAEAQTRAAARHVAAAEAAQRRAERRTEALEAELAANPTPEQHQRLERQVDILSRRLSRLQALHKSSNFAFRSAAAKPALAPPGAATVRAPSGSSAALDAIGDVPKAVLAELVHTACRALRCSDALRLGEAIRAAQHAAAGASRLETFVQSVCDAVFEQGASHLPWGTKLNDPGEVPAVLSTWIRELQEATAARNALRALRRQLARLPPAAGGGASSLTQPVSLAEDASEAEVVAVVADLVDRQRVEQHTQAMHAAAEAALASASPDSLLHRIVREFMRLFAGVSGAHRQEPGSLQGVLPCVYRLHDEVTANRAFLRALRASLGLPPRASLDACSKAVAALTAQAAPKQVTES